jgi:DNA-binding PadR family transcriptional regulator
MSEEMGHTSGHSAAASKPLPTPLGYALLTLVVAEGRETHGYQIVKAVRERGGALGYSDSQIYRELKTLAANGYLEIAPGEIIKTKRPVATYNRTPLAFEVLKQWVESPVGRPEVDVSEVIPRIRAARLVSARSVLWGLQWLPELLDDELEALRLHERHARREYDWNPLMELEFDLQRRLIHAYAQWTERAQSSLETLAAEQTPASEFPSVEEANEFLRFARSSLKPAPVKDNVDKRSARGSETRTAPTSTVPPPAETGRSSGQEGDSPR